MCRDTTSTTTASRTSSFNIRIWRRARAIPIPSCSKRSRRSSTQQASDYPNRSRVVWGLLEECARAAGGYTNIDFGRTGRFLSQQELHDAIRGVVQTNSGNVHVKTSPHWDLGTAVRLTKSLGFKGLYSIEVDQDPAVRVVYNIVLANLSS
jgi:hypothetical protein